MTDVELGPMDSQNVQLILNMQESVNDITEEKITANNGLQVSVYVVGDKKRPALVTFHDLGLNANSCFQSFFQFSEMSSIADRFCIYHINAPGQEEDAEPFAENYVYPTLDELADTIGHVVSHFNLKSFVGFGVGAGANIFCRYALKNPKIVDALILVNCTSTAAGWIEWGYEKLNVYYLRSRGMTTLTVDYLMWHHFGRNLDQYNFDLVNSYKQYFSHLPNPKNLAGFIESYIRRVDLNIRREGPTLQCPILQIVGSGSPHINDSVDFNGRLDPSKSNWLKVSDCSGLVLEEKPDKVAEAILLFLQGQGHFPSMSHLKWRQQSRSNSVNGTYMQRSHSLQPTTIMTTAHVDVSLKHVNVDEEEMFRPQQSPVLLTATANQRSHSIANPESHLIHRVQDAEPKSLTATKEEEANFA